MEVHDEHTRKRLYKLFQISCSREKCWKKSSEKESNMTRDYIGPSPHSSTIVLGKVSEKFTINIH